MYEIHQQDPNTTKLVTPGHAPLTCETAVALVKKKNHSLDEERTRNLGEAVEEAWNKPEAKSLNLGEAINQSPPPTRGRTKGKDRLGIPFIGDTKEYMRAYYYCRRDGKTYSELSEELKVQHGIASTPGPRLIYPDKAVPKVEEKTKPITDSGTRAGTPPAVDLPPTMIDAVFKALTEFGHELKASQDFRKEQLTVLKQIDLNLSAMNNNTLILRTAITELGSDLKRYSGGKH